MDLEQLYSPSKYSKRYAPNEVVKKHVEFIEEYTKLVNDIPQKLGVAYGSGGREKYNLYGTDLPDGSPILVHIHGGYYQHEVITHSNNGFISNVFHKNGIKTILLGYELSPHRTVPEILKNIQLGLTMCISYAKKFKTRSVFLSGHSAGAHAIATFLTNFKKSLSPEDAALIKGVFLIDGIYDIEPLTKTSINDKLNLSPNLAKELSPLYDQLNYEDTAVYVIVGEYDSPAFITQGMEFYKKLFKEGVKAQYKLIPKVDHFNVLENLFFEEYELTKLMVNAIKTV